MESSAMQSAAFVQVVASPTRAGSVTSSRRRCVVRMSRSEVRMSAKLADMLEKVPVDLRRACLALPEDSEMVEPLGRRTKIVCTIGPVTCSYENLLRLTAEGMNAVRLNMCHGDYEFHRDVLKSVRRINEESPFVVGSIVDLGSLDMVRLGEFSTNPKLEKGDTFTLTVRHEAEYEAGTSEVSFDGFLDVVEVDDLVQIDGGVEMLVRSVNNGDVICEVTEGGDLRSRAPLMLRGKSYGPRQTDVPEGDLEFAVSEKVDYVSLSFVERESQVEDLRRELRSRGSDAGIIAKLESAGALRNLDAIIRSADAIMVARGDLGTSIPYEKVPLWQERIAHLCRVYGKPVLVSTHFLDSMVTYPTPTRAEITDIFEAVRQKADALVLTAETASGRFPFKALSAMHTAAKRMESKAQESPEVDTMPPLFGSLDVPLRAVSVVAENISNTACILANQRLAKAVIVFTQKGLMASLVSRNRPNAPVLAFTPYEHVRERLTLYQGVRPFFMDFSDDPEQTIGSAFSQLQNRGWVESGDLVVIVADILGGKSGAPQSEKRAVFDEFAVSDRIPYTKLRAALRRMSLKAPDAVEMSFSRGVDVSVDYPTFDEVVSQAQKIVHTIQLRHCP